MAAAASLLAGARVQIDGLKARADLNGSFGTVDGLNEANGRWKVTVDGTLERIMTREANLVVVTVAADADIISVDISEEVHADENSRALQMRRDALTELMAHPDRPGEGRAAWRASHGQEGVFCRARCLLAVGAWHTAVALLEPHMGTDTACARLSQEAQARRMRATEVVTALSEPRFGARLPLPDDCAYIHSAIELRHGLPGKGRGWIVVAPIESGELLLLEPALLLPLASAPASTATDVGEAGTGHASPRPLADAVRRRLGELGGGADADALRAILRLMRADGSALHAASAAAGGEAAGGEAEDDESIIDAVCAQSPLLTTRYEGEAMVCGASLFPLHAVLNHSCHCNASQQPIGGGQALATRARRAMQPGDEVTICLDTDRLCSQPRAQRRATLQQTYGFHCVCERCVCQQGTHLYERERLSLALTCPLARAALDGGGGGGGGGSRQRHLMLPDDAGAQHPSFACEHPSCGAQLSAAEAAERLQGVNRRLHGLNQCLVSGEYARGCEEASRTEVEAATLLSTTHHLWDPWTKLASVLAYCDTSEHPELSVRAYQRKEGLLYDAGSGYATPRKGKGALKRQGRGRCGR